MQGKNRMKYFYTVGKTTALLISCLLFSAAIYAEDGKKGQKKDDQEKPDKKAAVLIMRDEEMKKELFQGKELVGCPSALSITVNVVLNSAAEIFYEYGTEPGKYSVKTKLENSPANTPINTLLDELKPDVKYYYRLSYRTDKNDFIKREEHSFQTLRNPGSTFTFVVEADPHLDENSEPAIYKSALKSIGAGKPDFLIDLGDTFMSDKLEEPTYENIEDRVLLFRNYFDSICHSIPLFLVLGNHEGEAGWPDKKTGNRICGWDEKARTRYFLNPLPGGSYTGNAEKNSNYYAFTSGDALFVAIDPYRYTPDKPGKNSSDGWGWTLGKTQYLWLKETLEKSRAKYKFVFGHQLVGGNEEGRGGAEFAGLYEWGGLNKDGSNGFESKRPGWGKPIHKLLVDTGVNIFFHGHDHFFAKQEKDGVIYQEVPQPSCRNTREPRQAEEYGYKDGIIQGNSGYLRVSVSPENAGVDYIRFLNSSSIGEVSYSYSFKSKNKE